ncbi:sulfhydryl oxidase [Elysia marginata]|uniref:Sulfhydryl oxidase n=1 Tax=Elysia marginata TaxID=1093978 RepID=A0AAV4GVJ3_9GAST|nr:sulfhydryl oxidase [Elysia marginata]
MSHTAPLPWLHTRSSARLVPKNEWGPCGWAWLHTQAINFPEHPTKLDQMAMFARFWSFIQTLPCLECRIHSTKYAREYPPDFSGSAGFQTWAWRFHNAVNYRLGKPLMSAEEYRRKLHALQ